LFGYCEPLAWPVGQRDIFNLAPHINGTLYGDQERSDYMSHLWYHLQVVVNAHGRGGIMNPVDWNYQQAFLGAGSREGQSLRSVVSTILMWQLRSNGYGNDGGYSGRCFEIATVEGEQVTLKGPWSSRAGCVNKRSFGPVVDVRLATDPSVLEKGYTFKSGTLTLSAAKQAIDRADADAHLERVVKFDSDEPYWVPVRTNGGDS
jgi:hypothetical protein